jgi:hypothetical protein
MNILVVKLSSIGDIVFTLPCLAGRMVLDRLQEMLG